MSGFEYIVQCRGENIVIKTFDKLDIGPLACQKLKCVKAIPTIEKMELEVFHQPLQCFYTPSDVDDIPDGGIIKLTLVEPAKLKDPAREHLIIASCSKVVPMANMDDDVTEAKNSAGAAIQSQSKKRSGDEQQLERLSLSKFGTNADWKSPFRVPVEQFPPSLRESLLKQGVLSMSEKSALLSILYEEITTYTFYPTSRQYDDVARALLDTYRHLDYKLPTYDALKYWRMCLSTKMRNMRQCRDKNVPIVIEKRNKKSLNQTEAVKDQRKKSNAAYGVKHYLPERPEGEDDASIARHVQNMIHQEKKKAKDYRLIDLAMEKTFGDRRQILVNENPTIQQIKERFPCLFDTNQLLYEFQRLTEMDIMSVLKVSLAKYGSAILQLAKVAIDKAQTDALDETELVTHHALLAVETLMREKVFQSTDEFITAPKLSFIGNLDDLDVEGHLCVEQEVVCPVQGVLQASAVWLASYYVFNCEYPETFKKTLMFMQKIFLGINTQYKTAAIITSTQKKLNVILTEKQKSQK